MAELPGPLKDGIVRCLHDMVPEWCAVCLKHSSDLDTTEGAPHD